MNVQGCELVVATPCRMDWDKMHGDEKKRFCHQCSSYVYDFESMNEAEQLDLVKMVRNNEKVCTRLYVRTDGKVLLRDCRLGKKLELLVSASKTAIVLLLSATFVYGLGKGTRWARAEINNQLNAAVQEPLGQPTMGQLQILDSVVEKK